MGTHFWGWRRVALSLAVVAGGVVFCLLGIWQVSRMNERLALIEEMKQRLAEPPIALDLASISPEALDYRLVTVSGVFDPSQEVLLRNRSYNGSTGYHVVTPLRISGSDQAVMVDRGWIPYDKSSREQRAAFAPPTGEVSFTGIVRVSQEGTTPPLDPTPAAGETRLDAWFRVNIPRIQQQVNLPLLPIFLEEQPNASDTGEFPVKGGVSLPDAGNHLAYAIQWFSFAIILVGGYVAVSIQQWQRVRRGLSDDIFGPHIPTSPR